jgi:hypothetical protein
MRSNPEQDGSGQPRNHLLIRRKPAARLFRKSQPPIDGNLENPAAAAPQLHLRIGPGLPDQVPNRDRSRLIASHSAVFDLDQHPAHTLCLF